MVHPHYTEEDEAYYRAVFCIIDHDDSRQFLHDMQNIVEGNSDYALHKTHYLPALGQRMLDTGASSARRNSRRCVRTSSAAARYCAKTTGEIILTSWQNCSISPASNKIVLLMTGSLSQNIRSSSRHSTTFFCGGIR
nr:Uncharacterised protein [Klebsiella pneumoniae]